MVWLKFIFCALIILFAGSKLTKYADVIAEKTGLSRAWLGLTLLAMITSLPELANAISAVAIVKLPDLALGDILGACMINMFALSLLDIWQWLRGQEPIFLKNKQSNAETALFGVIMLLFVALGLVFSHFYFDLSFLGVSVYAIVILLLYLGVQKILLAHSQGTEVVVGEENYLHLSGTQTYLRFSILAIIVVMAGSWLPFIGAEMVTVMGWGNTFVAVLFLGLATTLPEMTVSISALRLGHTGMSIGNLVGSNIFNVAIIFVADLFYLPGSLLAAASFNMVYAALAGALLLGLAYVALKQQIKNRLPSLLMAAVYLGTLFLLFKSGLLS
ncbi:MAG: hypothetical protein ABH823_00810 [bacterium]